MNGNDGWELVWSDTPRPTLARKRFLQHGKLTAPAPGQPAEVWFYPDGALLREIFVERTGERSVWHRHDGTVVDVKSLAESLLNTVATVPEPGPPLEL